MSDQTPEPTESNKKNVNKTKSFKVGSVKLARFQSQIQCQNLKKKKKETLANVSNKKKNKFYIIL
jgi:hypothetical protein